MGVDTVRRIILLLVSVPVMCFGQAAQEFDGVQSYMSFGSTLTSCSINMVSNTASVSFWIKTSDTTYEFILGAYSAGVPSYGMGCMKSGVTSKKISAWFGGPSWITGTNDVTDGVWHFVVMTCTGTTGKLYFDGVQEGNGTINGMKPWLSARRFGNYTDSSYTYALTGSLADMRIYNRALSDGEIRQIYTAYPRGTDGIITGLSGRWIGDITRQRGDVTPEPAVASTYDISGNGNTATNIHGIRVIGSFISSAKGAK